jgi:hypothetical protein
MEPVPINRFKNGTGFDKPVQKRNRFNKPVPKKNRSTSPTLNNTFQLVIATDGKISFLTFNFGNMSWPNSQFTMNSFFGYNAGDNINYYSYPDSFTNNITNVASKSNVIYQVNGFLLHLLLF